MGLVSRVFYLEAFYDKDIQSYRVSVPRLQNELSVCLRVTAFEKSDFSLYLNGFKFGTSVNGVLELKHNAYRDTGNQDLQSITVNNMIKCLRDIQNSELNKLEESGQGFSLNRIDVVTLKFLNYMKIDRVTLCIEKMCYSFTPITDRKYGPFTKDEIPTIREEMPSLETLKNKFEFDLKK